MAKKQTLPHRKWYSLQQAADKLTREFGEPVTIDDLLHYYQIGLLELSVYISTSAKTIKIGKHIFSTFENIDGKKMFPRNILDFHLLSEYQEDIFIRHLFSIKKGTETTYQNKFLKINVSNFNKEFDNLIFIDGFMNLLDAIGNGPKAIKDTIEKGINLARLNYLVSPDHGDDYRIVILTNLNENNKENIFIQLDDLYVLDSDLKAFLNGKNKEKDVEKIIEKSKVGRKRDNRHKEIIETSKAFSVKYPEANRESIKNAVMNLLNIDDLSDEQIRRYLKEENIGKPHGSSISNMTL
jgi:hypothetical protein